jgi:2-haloacid dehalogenase
VAPAAVVFDLFGTLLDIASLRDAVAPAASDPAAFVTAWRDKQIAYSFASAIMGTHETFDAITEDALTYTAEKFGVTLDADARARLAGAWRLVAPYEDAAPALDDVRARGIARAVQTNGSPATAAAAMSHVGFNRLIEVTLSVESAGVFKPDRRVYELVTAHFGVEPNRLLFVTSNGWDATGAAVFGMRVAWCNRAGVPAETFGPAPEWTIGSLADLTAIIDAF